MGDGAGELEGDRAESLTRAAATRSYRRRRRERTAETASSTRRARRHPSSSSTPLTTGGVRRKHATARTLNGQHCPGGDDRSGPAIGDARRRRTARPSRQSVAEPEQLRTSVPRRMAWTTPVPRAPSIAAAPRPPRPPRLGSAEPSLCSGTWYHRLPGRTKGCSCRLPSRAETRTVSSATRLVTDATAANCTEQCWIHALGL